MCKDYAMSRLPRIRLPYLFLSVAAAGSVVSLFAGHEAVYYSRRNSDLGQQLESTRSAVNELYRELGALDRGRSELEKRIDEIILKYSALVPVDSHELAQDALYFDASGDARILRAVCTGSMEPALGCDDIILAYKPAITDIAVGDIISFRTSNDDCSGYSENLYTLHRVTGIMYSGDELYLQTKGDASQRPDKCLIPATAVDGKVLAIIYDSRIGR